MNFTNPLRLLSFITLTPFLTSAFSTPKVQSHNNAPTSAPTITPLPLIIWHGLGDSYDADGIKATVQLAETTNPATYTHVIQLGDDGSTDRRATFFGNVSEQIAAACHQLASDPILRTAPAVNALGFSQGGQFLRAYVERCNAPPVRNLVTFGSQHNGISDFEHCATDGTADFVCQSANALLKLGTWSDFVQARLVPAQYFRDPERLDEYLEASNFLADVNNERVRKNQTYADNVARLNRFAMYMFADDMTVVPKESAWFAEYNKTTKVVTPLAERKIYTEDWIGLKRLAEKGGLVFDLLKGEHMRFSEKDLKKVMQEYFGPVQVDGDGQISDIVQLREVVEDEL